MRVAPHFAPDPTANIMIKQDNTGYPAAGFPVGFAEPLPLERYSPRRRNGCQHDQRHWLEIPQRTHPLCYCFDCTESRTISEGSEAELKTYQVTGSNRWKRSLHYRCLPSARYFIFLQSLRRRRSLLAERRWRHASNKGVRSCPRAGCGKSARPVPNSTDRKDKTY